MYSRAAPSPLDPAQVVENRIVWISKQTVLNNLTWVGGWGKLQKLEKCFRNNRNNRWISQRCFLNFSCNISVETLSSLVVIQFAVEFQMCYAVDWSQCSMTCDSRASYFLEE